MSEQENNTTAVLGEDLETSTDQSNNDNDTSLADQTQEEDYLSNFVGEGKPYQSVEEAAKALAKKAVNADQFIETLKKEKQELEAKSQEAKTVEDIIAKLNEEAGQQAPSQDPSEEAPKGLTVDQLEEWYENRQKQAEQKAKEEAQVAKIKENQEKSWQILESEEYFGSRENAKLAMRKYLEADESRREVVNNLGGYDPEGLAKLLKAVTPNEEVNYTDNDNVTTSDSSFPSGQLTWDKVRAAEKENPALKKDRKWHNYVNKNLVL